LAGSEENLPYFLNPGTAEPFNISPAKPAAYNMELLLTLSAKKITAVWLIECQKSKAGFILSAPSVKQKKRFAG